MADTDVLPSRGVPRMALVDLNRQHVATRRGSSTIAQLAAKGIQSICAVDATGVSVGGPNVAQLASAGIRSFCPVDENGVAQDSSDRDQASNPHQHPPRMVLLGNTGIALTGISSLTCRRWRGAGSGYFAQVDESGNAPPPWGRWSCSSNASHPGQRHGRDQCRGAVAGRRILLPWQPLP